MRLIVVAKIQCHLGSISTNLYSKLIPWTARYHSISRHRPISLRSMLLSPRGGELPSQWFCWMTCQILILGRKCMEIWKKSWTLLKDIKQQNKSKSCIVLEDHLQPWHSCLIIHSLSCMLGSMSRSRRKSLHASKQASSLTQIGYQVLPHKKYPSDDFR